MGEPAATPIDEAHLMNKQERLFLGIYIALMWLLFLYLFGKFWPYEFTDKLWMRQPNEVLFCGLLTIPTSAEIRLLVLMLCAGALGAMVHALQSFADFHGNRQLAKSWMPWYLLRPFVGALMALIFYLLLRGGLVTGVLTGAAGEDATHTAVRVFGLTGAAALIGMFSDLAALKIKDVFTTLFAAPVKQRSDPLVTPPAKPEITELKPDKLTIGATTLKINVLGKNFVKEAKVLVGDKERPQSFVSSGEMTVQLDPADVTAKADLKIVVENPASAGGKSDPKILPVS
jgi:hypothetical protein